MVPFQELINAVKQHKRALILHALPVLTILIRMCLIPFKDNDVSMLSALQRQCTFATIIFYLHRYNNSASSINYNLMK